MAMANVCTMMYTSVLQLAMILLEIGSIYSYYSSSTSMMPRLNMTSTCCNGILGYAVPEKTMPCSDMRCCNVTETVALQKVNHALGFSFRCVPRSIFDEKSISEKKCYRNGEEVASTNSTTMEYTLRTCCRGLRFTIVTYTNNVALTIKCINR